MILDGGYKMPFGSIDDQKSWGCLWYLGDWYSETGFGVEHNDFSVHGAFELNNTTYLFVRSFSSEMTHYLVFELKNGTIEKYEIQDKYHAGY